MSIDDRDISRALRNAAGGETPGFDAVWSAARARAAAGERPPGRWRYGLGPALALGIAAVAWVAASGLMPAAPGVPGVREAAAPDDAGTAVPIEVASRQVAAGSRLSDSLLDGLDEDLGATDEADDAGAGFGAAPTDVLLGIEIPAWDEAGERGVL